MSFGRNKLFAVLLAFLIALAPTVSVLADDHACDAEGSGMPPAAGHAGHMQSDAVMHDGSAQTLQAETGSCQDCSTTCCDGAACSANACGSGVSAVGNTSPSPLGSHRDVVSPTDPQMALSERLSSLFRPPPA